MKAPIALRLSCALALVLAAIMQPASAATVSITVNSNGGPCYTTSAGALLDPGDIIRVGYFDLSNPTVVNTLQTSNSYTVVNALFTPLAESKANGGTIFQNDANSNPVSPGGDILINNSFSPGHVFGGIQNIDSTYFSTGTQLSVWVFNSATPTSATEWGIFSASSGWNFPAANGSETLSSAEVNTYERGYLDVANGQLRLAVIPEPGGATLLMSLGLLLQLRRRNRGR
jgi:hypothetical protein